MWEGVDTVSGRGRVDRRALFEGPCLKQSMVDLGCQSFSLTSKISPATTSLHFLVTNVPVFASRTSTGRLLTSTSVWYLLKSSIASLIIETPRTMPRGSQVVQARTGV